jgi:hypothetical protein
MKFLSKKIVKRSALLFALSQVMFFGTAAYAKDYMPNNVGENDSISRKEVCEMLIGLGKDLGAELKAPEENPYKDTDNEAILALSEAGVVNGVGDDEFAPEAILTREQMCTMLTRLIGYAYKDTVDTSIHPRYVYYDNSYISYWAKASVDYLYFHGIMIGTEENVISPLETLTYRQAADLCQRTFENKENYVLKTDIPDFNWEIEPTYDGLVPDTIFACGLASVKKDGKYGYINQSGKTIVPFIYDRTYDFSDGIGRVEKDGKVGYITTDGKLITKIEYEAGGDMCEDRVWVKKDGKYGFLDKQGNIAIPFIYDYAYEFEENIAPVKKGGKYGAIDKGGNTVIEFKFLWLSHFAEGYARIFDGEKYGYVNKSGEIVIEPRFWWANDFSEGVAAVTLDKWQNLIDKDGNYLHNSHLAWVQKKSEGVVGLWPGDEYERRTGLHWAEPNGSENGIYKRAPIIDLNTQPPVISEAKDFHEGLCAVSLYNETYEEVHRSYINKEGKFLFPNRDTMTDTSDFDRETFYLMNFSEGMAAVVNWEGKLGFVKNPLF